MNEREQPDVVKGRVKQVTVSGLCDWNFWMEKEKRGEITIPSITVTGPATYLLTYVDLTMRHESEGNRDDLFAAEVPHVDTGFSIAGMVPVPGRRKLKEKSEQEPLL